jgi:putative Mg2+ transporter-C (MgtC) family protein
MLTLEIQAMSPAIHNFTRLMSYGLASIGFIGSGVIIHNKRKVEGVTTAATLWATVPMGYLIGLGHYVWAMASAFIIWIILEAKYKDCFYGNEEE